MKMRLPRKLLSNGFSAVVLIAAVATILGVGAAGWFVVKNDDTDKNNSSTTNNQTMLKQTESEKRFSLLDGKVSFPDDGTWKVATGGYWSIERQLCGRDTGQDPGCVDHKMLIPATEQFTNPDQYQVNIMVFEREGVSLSEWNVVSEGTRIEGEQFEVGDLEGRRYEENYGTDELRVTYNISWQDKMIVVKSTFFKGDYYSYKSNTDYSSYIPKLDQLVKGLKIDS